MVNNIILKNIKPMLTLEKPKQLTATKKSVPAHNDLWLDINTTHLGIAHVYEFTDFMKRAWNIDETSYLNIHGALSEALTNSAEHGNKWDEDKQIHIHARREEEHFIVTITDEGEGFNYRKIENPTDMGNRSKEGGRGIFIMNYLADNVQFSEGGRCTKLFFRNAKNF
jgi:serine/threonine-protein kinase RsbW